MTGNRTTGDQTTGNETTGNETTGKPSEVGALRAELDALRARVADFQRQIEGCVDAAAGRVAAGRVASERDSRERALIEGAPVVITLKDAAGRYLLVNRQFEHICGLGANDVLGRTAGELFAPDVAGPIAEHDREVRETGQAVVREREVRTPTAVLDFIEASFPVFGTGGEVVAIGLVGTDITDRKRAEQCLRASEGRFREFVEQADVIPWEAVSDHREFTYVGPQAERILGYPSTEWRTAGFWVDHLHPADRDWASEFDVAATRRNDDHTFEYRMLAADGRVVWLRDLVSVESDVAGGRNLRGFMVDVSEIKESEVALREAIQNANLANRAKTEFLANMSHELRTPLNAIIGFAETIEDEILGPLGNDRYKDYARDIKASAVHLLGLINEILDLAKIEAGKFELHDEPVAIAEVVDEAWRLLRPRAESAEMTFAIAIPDPFPQLRVDRLKFKQILVNLLSNAVKFTGKGGAISVGAGITDVGEACVTVSDTGIGMTKDDVTVALEMFRQVDSSFSRRYEGTGLGLPLTQKLAELHGGRMEIESEKDRGTSVHVFFPADRVVGRSASR